MNIDWPASMSIGLSAIASLAAVGAVIVALVTLRKVSKQTELLRRQVFGEVYDTAQIKNLEFFLPEKRRHAIEGFEEEQQLTEISKGDVITLPVDQEREIHIRWWMAESQTLRRFSIGFLDNYQGREFGFENKPKITDRVRSFVKAPWEAFVREEFLDWHGHYHCEYAHARRLAKEDVFVSALKVKPVKIGEYVLAVEVAVDEAPRPFRGILKVKCE